MAHAGDANALVVSQRRRAMIMMVGLKKSWRAQRRVAASLGRRACLEPAQRPGRARRADAICDGVRQPELDSCSIAGALRGDGDVATAALEQHVRAALHHRPKSTRKRGRRRCARSWALFSLSRPTAPADRIGRRGYDATFKCHSGATPMTPDPRAARACDVIAAAPGCPASWRLGRARSFVLVRSGQTP